MDSKSSFSNKLARPDMFLDDSTDFSRCSANRSGIGSTKMSTFGEDFRSSRCSSKVFTNKPFDFSRIPNRIHKVTKDLNCNRYENLEDQDSFHKEYDGKFNEKKNQQQGLRDGHEFSNRTRECATPQPGYEKNKSYWTMEDRRGYEKSFRATTPTLPPSANPSQNISLQISGLSGFDPEYNLRKLCEGFHVVSINAPCDSLTGASLGKAGLVLKSNQTTLKHLEMHLLSKGLQLSQKPIPLGKKNNYAELAKVNFLDPFVNSSSSKTPARHHLQTTENVFGSSSGVGKFHSKKRVEDKQALVLHTWNAVRRPSKPSESVKNLTSIPSYMRSTQSSLQKFRKLT